MTIVVYGNITISKLSLRQRADSNFRSEITQPWTRNTIIDVNSGNISAITAWQLATLTVAEGVQESPIP